MLDRRVAQEILAFYLDSGVDCLLSEEPIDRFADTPTIAPEPAPAPSHARPPSAIRASLPPRQAPPAAPAAPAPFAPDVAVMAAREAARNAATLDELRAIMSAFEGCALRKTAKQLVFADGNPQARLMLVGEAPGSEEDRAGLPFVGRSGKLLDLMLAAIGLDRNSVYIANIIPWRPPGNRTPTPQESQICLPFITRQIELVDPDVLVCLGGPSSQALLGFSDGIRRTRGRWLSYATGTREIRAMATFHPAYLLRSPLEKRLAWRDFLAVKQALVQTT
ncbi:MAG TPA: uracil-DNA glycosylase [Xanthobacteraceae bacterium]|nr:uracil-DNA glycosylase [Xanthobacteraceae bacterium]